MWLANVVVALLVLEHIYALVLEMFLWTRPTGLKAFGNTAENAAVMAVLAKNQGLYNGFLAAGLLCGLVASNPTEALHLKLFFSGCVLLAGIYGFATTGKRSILIGQGGLAALALGLLLLL